ncbi:MAG: cytochrome c oxidase subunit II [Alphaproteobacteria bacterium]|nr:cytochrome c oxidase subunit II [Alphaproteobacteria bacterium]
MRNLNFFLFLALAFFTTAAFAAEPLPMQLNLQPAVTPVAEKLHDFHNLLLVIITAITIFVMGLLLYVMVRFNAKANPVPSTTTHNVPLEIIWTVIPVLILIVIAVPSFRILYFADKVEKPEMTLKITGYQWYWGYEYPDYGDVSFQAYLIKDSEIDASQHQKRLLSTDNPVVVPTDTNIRLEITAGPTDVLHAWTIPAFGVKKDAVPGRLNEAWMRVTEPGTYYGQCSELCGKGHGFMPIEVKAVPKAEFEQWIVAQGGKLPAPEAEAASEETTETPKAE